jgi:hypothetical protein
MTGFRPFSVLLDLIAVVLIAAPSLHAAAGSYGASGAGSVPVEFAPAVELEAAALELKDSAASLDVSDGQVHRNALNLFAGTHSGDGAVVATYRTKTEWFDTEASFDNSLENQPDQIRRILRRAQIAPPEPGKKASHDDPSILWEVLEKLEEMMTEKAVSYDSTGELSDNQLGVFKYREKPHKESIGIVFNQRLKGAVNMLSAPVGSLATAMHEAAHRYLLDQGELNSKDVKKGEMFSFKIQDMFLQAWDPKGYYLATVNWILNKKVGADPFYKGVAGHMMDVRRFVGEKNDPKGLVDYLGYEDKHDHDHGLPGADDPAHANRIRFQHDCGHDHALGG